MCALEVSGKSLSLICLVMQNKQLYRDLRENIMIMSGIHWRGFGTNSGRSFIKNVHYVRDQPWRACTTEVVAVSRQRGVKPSDNYKEK